MKINGNITLNSLGVSEIQNLVVERLASIPLFYSADKGRILYNTTDNNFYLNTGTTYVSVATGGSATAIQAELDNVEAALGSFVNADGTVNTTPLNSLTNVTGAASLMDALSQIDSAITGQDHLSALKDVNIGAVTDKQYLKYDGVTLKWIPDTLTLADVTDITATYIEVNYLSGVTSSIQTQINTEVARATAAEGTLTTNLNAEISRAQNAEAAIQGEVDTIETGAGLNTNGTYTADATSNYLTGSTSLYNSDHLLDAQIKIVSDGLASFQSTQATKDSSQDTAINARVIKTGDTMTGSLTMSGAGVQVVNPNIPVSGNDLANKTYVDNVASTGTSWKHPALDPNLQDVVSTDPSAGLSGAIGDSFTFIYTGISTTLNAGGATLLVDGSVTPQIVQVIITAAPSTGDWSLIGALTSADRIILAGESGNIGATLYAAGFRKNDVLAYSTGDPTLAGSWGVPEDGGFQSIKFNAPKASTDPTGLLNDTTQYDLNVAINGVLHNLIVLGQDGQTFGNLAIALGNAMNAAYTGASATLATDGNIQLYSGDGKKVLIEEGTGVNPLLTGLGTNFDIANIRNNILGGIITGATILIDDSASHHYGHTYLFSPSLDGWTEIAGPGYVGAGTGLGYAGSTLNIQTGAGITALADYIIVDNYTAGGLWLTTDGLAASTATNAQLAIKLADTSLSLSSTGIQLSATLQTAISTNTTNISTETTNRQSADAAIQSELDTTQTGAGLNITGTYITDGGTNYISGATSLANADHLLDAAIASEAATRSANDTTLQTNINTEASTRSTNDQAVNTRITNGYFLYIAGGASTSHVVTHNIGTQYCVVSVVDAATDELVIPQSVTFTNVNSLTVTFNTALSCKIAVMGIAASPAGL